MCGQWSWMSACLQASEEYFLNFSLPSDIVNLTTIFFILFAGIDAAFCDNLKYFLNELEDDEVVLIFANPNKQYLLAFQRSGLIVQIRPENLQLTIEEALARGKEVCRAKNESEGSGSLSQAEKIA